MQEWWNAYAAERLLAGEILAWGAFLVVMFMLIAMASIKYQQAVMTYFRADDVPADEFLAQQNPPLGNAGQRVFHVADHAAEMCQSAISGGHGSLPA